MRSLLALCFALLASAPAIRGQWFESQGIVGSHTLTAVLVHGDEVLLGTQAGGLFVSSDHVTWSPVRNGLPIGWINRLREVDGAMYAGVRDVGTFRSTDDGASWRQIPGVQEFGEVVAANDAVYLAAGALYRSDDHGTTFREITDGLEPLGATHALAVDGSNLYAGGYTNVGRTTDGGATWRFAELHDSLHFVTAVTSMAARSGNVLAVSLSARHFSVDSGASFTIEESDNPVVYDILPCGDAHLMATRAGLYSTPDGGISTAPIGPRAELVGASCEGTRIVAIARSRIYFSEDGGRTWVDDVPGISAQPVSAIDVIPEGIVAASTRLFVSNDRGEHFALAAAQPAAGAQVGMLGHSDLYLFAFTGGPHLFRARSTAGPWEDVSGAVGDSGIPIGAMYVHGSTILLASWYYGIYHSSDNGDNWSATGGSDPGGWWTTPVGFAAFGESIFFATQGALMRTDDNGTLWRYVESGPLPIHALAASPTALYVATDSTILRSTDGLTFTPAGTLRGVTTLLAFSDLLFAGTASEGVMVSRDAGATWQTFAGQLSALAAHINALAIDGDRLLAATGSNVWWASLPPASIPQVHEASDLRVWVDDAAIHVSGSHGKQLELLDMLGRRIVSVSAAASSIDRIGIPSGVYLLRCGKDAVPIVLVN